MVNIYTQNFSYFVLKSKAYFSIVVFVKMRIRTFIFLAYIVLKYCNGDSGTRDILPKLRLRAQHIQDGQIQKNANFHRQQEKPADCNKIPTMIKGNDYELATNIINTHKIQKLKEDHATRFLQILLGYKSCHGYISITEQYGCHCGLQKKNCKTSKDCLDDCCRKFEQCRNSINIPSINCSGYEPYEYSWAHNKTNGQSSYVYSVEYFGVRSTINRTKMISNNEIICKDCEYLEDDRKNNDLINNHRGILLWRDCHCRACMCDKAFAHCISAYKCPYDEKTLSAEKGVKNETRYLTQDECHTKAVNVSGYLPI